MNKLKYLIPLIAICLFLGGCPYESKIPIDSPSVKINAALLGKWEPKSTSGDHYIVSKLDDFTYKIEVKKKDDKDPTVYNAYLSNIDNDVFLNLYNSKEELERKYYFYKLTINKSETKLTLASVTENIDEKFEKPEEMKSFFQKSKNLSFFFEKEEDVYIKED